MNLKDGKKSSDLDLKYLITDKSTLKHVTFDGLKKQSHLRFKELHFNQYDKDEKEFANHPSHFINVTVKNSSYVFDLDKHAENEIKEIEFVESTDQLHDLDNFVNTGMCLN